MKFNKVKILVLSAIASAAFLTGCATEHVSPAQPAMTNQVTGIVTPAQPAVTNYTANQSATQIGASIQAASPLVPAPYNIPVGILGGLIGAVAGSIAGFKNAKTKGENALQAVITGVESSISGNPALITQIRDNVSTAATSNGSGAALQNANVVSAHILP